MTKKGPQDEKKVLEMTKRAERQQNSMWFYLYSPRKHSGRKNIHAVEIRQGNTFTIH
jgi:hypothetical protein